MQRVEHDLIPELIAARPASILDLVRDAIGVELVPREAVAEVAMLPSHVPQLVPPELACDAAIEIVLVGGERQAVVLEIQLDTAAEKALVWPLYWAAMRRAIDGGVTTLVVITLDERVERWATGVLAQVIPAAGRWHVIGPSNARRITDPGIARADPQAAVLSALIHAGRPGDVAFVPAIAAVLSTMDRARGTLAEELMFKRLTETAWNALEAQMDLDNYQWTAPHIVRYVERRIAERTAEVRDAVMTEGLAAGRTEGRAEGRAEGRVEGRREQQVNAVLAVLEARGLSCTDAIRARIETCTDGEALDQWLRRAAVAVTVDDVFE